MGKEYSPEEIKYIVKENERLIREVTALKESISSKDKEIEELVLKNKKIKEGIAKAFEQLAIYTYYDTNKSDEENAALDMDIKDFAQRLIWDTGIGVEDLSAFI